ncbi:Metallo-hydrolase/oxidoreductase [Podospora fimiseda]|uniref:Metallo-hydrolase/oxidoreductase n=1 Tax=Podospora fimiseda TaxID=252190 RepID=A0AAN7BVB1_9PEZI|nr:Metallo-hydrolase/oxidoreductase [Podospora fimiseda]
MAQQPTVQVHALSAGHFSLPENQFVHPATPGQQKTVPSLCFLIQHPNSHINIVFDLGLRRDTDRYPQPIRQHITTRQPLTTDPDVVKSLAKGGLTPSNIDYVIYSHVHWDHVGEPRDFPTSTFVVGHGSLDLLSEKSSKSRGSHSHFESDLLDRSRTIELSDPSEQPESSDTNPGITSFCREWQPLPAFDLPQTLGIFGDGTLYIVNSPGHLPGHINLLCRTEDGWLYLAGDTCHDRRILSGEKEIGEWKDSEGHTCCIHSDRKEAERSIHRARELGKMGVEVVFSHDVDWEEGNKERFWGGSGLSTFIMKTNSIIMSSNNSQVHLDRFNALLGPSSLHEGWTSLLSLSPDFFHASVSLASVPRKKSHLPPKVQSLISLAVDSAATHLYLPGIRAHIKSAIVQGATIHEVIEVIELTSTLGIHACNIGVPLLVEVLKEQGRYEQKEFDENQLRLKEEFTKKRGYWHEFWEDFLRLDPEFFEAYLEFSGVPWIKEIVVDGKKEGVLEPKVKELVYCAFDAASTHLYVPGLKLHMKNALGYGATPEEILEVLEIATLLSLHTAHVAAPIIREVVAEAAKV